MLKSCSRSLFHCFLWVRGLQGCDGPKIITIDPIKHSVTPKIGFWRWHRRERPFGTLIVNEINEWDKWKIGLENLTGVLRTAWTQSIMCFSPPGAPPPHRWRTENTHHQPRFWQMLLLWFITETVSFFFSFYCDNISSWKQQKCSTVPATHADSM